jgi:hypothetical protein
MEWWRWSRSLDSVSWGSASESPTNEISISIFTSWSRLWLGNLWFTDELKMKRNRYCVDCLQWNSSILLIFWDIGNDSLQRMPLGKWGFGTCAIRTEGKIADGDLAWITKWRSMRRRIVGSIAKPMQIKIKTQYCFTWSDQICGEIEGIKVNQKHSKFGTIRSLEWECRDRVIPSHWRQPVSQLLKFNGWTFRQWFQLSIRYSSCDKVVTVSKTLIWLLINSDTKAIYLCWIKVFSVIDDWWSIIGHRNSQTISRACREQMIHR